MSSFYFSLFVLLIGSVSLAIPKPEEKKDRVLQKDLSDKKHYQDAEHNLEYDHEAFLGQEAKTFDQLSPDESKRRLGLIVDKIDKDHDGFVSQDELKNWMEYTQKKYIQDDVEKQWKVHVTPDQNELSWDTYKKNFYGFMEEVDQNSLDKNEDGYSYNYIIKRDRRRWDIADEDGNNALSKEEFLGFLHPEEIPHMKDVVVLETMEDIDKDKDGKISLKEYIGDIYKGEDDESEPDWVKNEREQFATYRDKNKDGYLDQEEVKSWIIPPDFDHAEAEARHLIYESDSDSDQKLTKAEILAKYNLFVGSQATDFGEALTRHDEF